MSPRDSVYRVMRRTAARCVLVPLLAILTACETSSRENDAQLSPAEVVEAAYQETLETETAGAEITGALLVGGTDVTVEADGEFDFVAGRGRLAATLQGSPEMEAHEKTELILDDFNVYVRSATFSAMPGVKNWVSLSGHLWGGQDLTLEVPLYLAKNEPIAWLHFLAGAQKVEELGSEDVDGEATTRYRVSLDLQKAINRLPKEANEIIGSTLFRIHTWGAGDIECEVWVDSEGHVRRQSMVFAYDDGPVRGDAVELTIGLSDFGSQVDIVAPPKSEVTDWFDVQ